MNASKAYRTWSPQESFLGVHLRWVVLARLSLLLLGLGAAAFSTNYDDHEVAQRAMALFGPIAALFGFCAASGLWLIWRPVSRLFAWVQVLADTLIITAVVYATGGPISPLLFLYLPLVIESSILLSRNAGLVVAAVCTVEYGFLAYSVLNGTIKSADGLHPTVPPSGLPLQLILLGSAMTLVAVLTSYLARRLSWSTELAKQSQIDLSELANRQNNLINSMPEGVIIVDQDGLVLTINPAAALLLNISPQVAAHTPVMDLLKGLDIPEDILNDNGHCSFEAELPSDHGAARSVVFQRRTIIENNGQINGTFYLFQNVTHLRSIEAQLEMQETMARLLAQPIPVAEDADGDSQNFLGKSPVMVKIFSLIRRVAPSDATVLINGESGTGKELVARAIHKHSPRNRDPFVPVNCGAIPENLIESHLFGHKKGSFTGADADFKGLFREAEGGTIFLDEIGELPIHMQAKLLRTIQTKFVRPVGGDRDIPINVRIIAATNRTLKHEVEQGNFREDLFYRLNVIGINLPPLRERKDDIPILVNGILRKLVAKDVTPVISPATMQLLMGYNYPGNVRELENILERAIVLGGEIILPEHLPETMRPTGQDNIGLRETKIIIDDSIEFPMNLDELLAKVEQRYLEAALLHTRGAKKKAATLLGMNFRSFRYRLQKFGIHDDEESESPSA